MQFFHSGFPTATYSKSEIDRRLQLILSFVRDETPASLWDSIIENAGDIQMDHGRIRWPLVVCEVVKSAHFGWRERFIWSGFCYHNAIPFGLMVAYPHASKVLRDQNAYADLLNSWATANRPKLDKMNNLMTYDRYTNLLQSKRLQ